MRFSEKVEVNELGSHFFDTFGSKVTNELRLNLQTIDMKYILTLVLFTCFSLEQRVYAQSGDDDKNIVISKATRQFKFVKGNREHPVQIEEESRRVYLCNNFRADVPFAEFYNDIETIEDVTIYVDDSKKHGIVPKFEYYNSDGIFFSDAHVCYFTLPLRKKGSTSEVIIKKVTLDPRYFTSIYFTDDQSIGEQEIKLKVPSWMELEIKEFNFGKYKINKQVADDDGDKIYTYTMQDIPAIKKERQSPGPSYYIPHILVMCKSAKPGGEELVYFKTLQEQYNWYRSLVEQIGNDEKIIGEKTAEITKGITSNEEKVKAIFQWVQDNIRYIAFENGLAGFKPEKAQEVLRKKYGDCKGMANLLTVMLKSIQLDARRCWIGTKHIAYDYSTPSLSVDNHMICAWIKDGKPVYLDATEKYIGLGEVTERIQGRQVLIENGKNYQLEKVPVATHLQNTATENRKLVADGNNLKGHIVQTWKGESKQWMLSNLNDIKQDKQENALKQFLAEGKRNFEISNLTITNISNYNADLKVEYDVLWKDALTVFDKEAYLDIDNRRNLDQFKMDTATRKLPYWVHYKDHLILETELTTPPDKVATTIPEKLAIEKPGYSFKAGFTSNAGKINYKVEIRVSDTELRPDYFNSWNSDIQKLSDFYNQQIVFAQKK